MLLDNSILQHSFCTDRANMVNRCVAAGCSNTPSDSVSLFRFSKDTALRRKWEKQVQRTRALWKVTEHSFLCSDHFTVDCFEVDSTLASQFGIKKRRRLKPGSVPTIFHRSLAQAATTHDQPELEKGQEEMSRKRGVAVSGTSATSKRRRVVEKRERHEVKYLCIYSIKNLYIILNVDCSGTSRGVFRASSCLRS